MDYNKIIIALLIVIIVILIVGLVVLNPFNSKENVNLIASSGNTLYDGDNFAISLSTSNGTPLANQNVNVVITDANGNANPQIATTDENGNGLVQLNGLTPGNYNITSTYDGNEKYNGNSTTQIVEMKASTTQQVSSDSSSGGTVTLDLPNYDQYVTKNVGEYEIKAYKWQGGKVGGLGVWVYKNGQLLDRNSYSSRGYTNVDGNWHWSEWAHGGEGAVYHKYPVSSGVSVEKVEVQF